MIDTVLADTSRKEPLPQVIMGSLLNIRAVLLYVRKRTLAYDQKIWINSFYKIG